MPDALAATFRELMIEAVRPHCNVPVLLSGGVDSATIVAALLVLGRTPACFTFRFGGVLNADVVVASQMTATFGLRHTIVDVPAGNEAILADVRDAIARIGRTTKTHVQCAIPFVRMARQIRAQGASTALFGMAADDLWGSDRKSHEASAKGAVAFRAFRAKKLADPDQSDWSVVKAAKSEGVDLVDPWRAKAIADFLLARTAHELYKPRPKHIAVQAFAEFWRRGAWYRENAALQVISGIRRAHDHLLVGTRHKAIIGLYNEVARGAV